MRLQQFISEKALIVNMSEINDILYVLDTIRELLDQIPSMDVFIKLVNQTIKESTGKGVVFKTKSGNSSEITANINANDFTITIFVAEGYFKLFGDDGVWRSFMDGVIGSLKHEITHGKQLLKVSDDYWDNNSQPFRVKDIGDVEQRKKNISHPHEVMAYAQNIIVELINHFGMSKISIINYLKKYKPGIVPNLDEYMTLFKKSSKTRKLLYRYMVDILNGTIK